MAFRVLIISPTLARKYYLMAELKILSYNLNGVRAAIKKGLLDWLQEMNADVVCIQELKADDGAFDYAAFEKLGYHCYTFPAEKKGYSGVAILTKIKPDKVVKGCGIKEYDDEGRIIRVDIGDLSILSVYIPSGTTGDLRQAVKMKYLDDLYTFMQDLQKERPKLLLCGDYNICHKEIDIHNPVSNKDTSGFKPEERAWMTKFFDSGFIDTFRVFHPEPHQYTWWSLRANSRANNKGWRIDYISATKNLAKNLLGAAIYPHAVHSDHCPVELKIKV
jgi:exodeoxyribonuclease-3